MPSVCRICLRSDFVRKKDIDEKLDEFHDELCDFDVFVNSLFTFCPICEHQLRKFYNFKQKCLRAHSIIKTKRSELKNKGALHLRDLMPPDTLGFSTPRDRQGTYFFMPTSSEPIITFQSQGREIIAIDCDDMQPPETAETDKLETEKLTDIDELTNDTKLLLKTEILTTDSDLIKSEYEGVDKPVLYIQDVKSIQEDVEVKQEVDDTDVSEANPDQKDGEMLMESLDSDDEIPLSENLKLKSDEKPKRKPAKKQKKAKVLTVSDLLDGFDSDDKVEVEGDNSKVPFDNESIFANDFSLSDLKLLSRTLCKSDRVFIRFQKNILKLKEHVLRLIEEGNLDLGENVILTKESFLGMIAKCDKNFFWKRGLFKGGALYTAKLKKFLLSLLKRFNPEYETTFHIEYLTTRALKVAEFNARKDSQVYITARFKCEKCFRGFPLQSLLDYHNKWHDPSRPEVCDICPMRFASRKQLSTHARGNHHTLYRCKLCELQTYGYDAMVNHYNQHQGVKYTCDVCLGEYSSKSSLNTHRLTHATHTCAHCARSFVSEPGLNNHVKFKHKDATQSDTPASPQRVSCDKCDAAFKSRDALFRHKKFIHSGQNNLFKCRYAGCQLQFSSAAELRQHTAEAGHRRCCPPDGGGRRGWGRSRGPRGPHARVRVNVTGPDKPYRTCPICKEQVPNKFALALYMHHTAAHPSEPYESADARDSLCEHCGKLFVHYSIYRDHLNTHTGARPYACAVCSAAFHTRSALNLHRDQHGPPRHQCKECGKMFRTAANLFSHRRMHIGDRRFKCEICLKGFLHAGSLKEHINGVHNQIRRVKKTK